ncbi:MAG: molybdopterin-dependent oxidoreductase [Gammaproteobacteria bacterium]|nr:molybdopterin-dependent oxidoreductase [Gammaproteobacteria bacterium]
MSRDLNRRDFLALLSAGTAGAGAGFWFGEALKHPVEQLIPALVPPEDLVPGIATWYASACTQCPAGCGILVKNREGRAKKIEGNPGHPVNQGGLCALGQAGLNLLYHPDRLLAPRRRSGARGAGQFQAAGWDEALAAIAQALAELRTQGRGASLSLISAPQTGHLDTLIHEVLAAFDSTRYGQHEAWGAGIAPLVQRKALGLQHAPRHDLAQARLVLSFGADFLASGDTPVHAARAYGQMRRGRPGQRGRLVQIEPRMSLTGANADLWLPVRPGSEGLVALGLGRALVAGGHYAGADGERWAQVLEPYTPALVARESGLTAGHVEALAAELAAGPALALAGGATTRYSNGLGNALAVEALNQLCGSLDRPGGVLGNPPPLLPAEAPVMDLTAWQTLIADARAGRVATLLFLDCNPLHELPPALGLREALDAVPLVVSLASLPDETSRFADWVLPLPSYLESWGDAAPRPGVGLRAAALAQPVVAPREGPRPAGDILLELARRAGTPLASPDYLAYLKNGWRSLHARRSDANAPADFDAFWNAALNAGVWGDGQAGTESPRWQPEAQDALDYRPARFAGGEADYPLVFQPYPSPNLHGASAAALPWLQELPDPLTGLAWGSWLEINPRTAAALGLAMGDIVLVESPAGRVEAPVLPYPAIHPALVAMPLGQGHEAFGRYAAGRGVNAAALVAPSTVEGTGALAWAATRVRLVKTGRRVKLKPRGKHDQALGRELFGSIPIKEL